MWSLRHWSGGEKCDAPRPSCTHLHYCLSKRLSKGFVSCGNFSMLLFQNDIPEVFLYLADFSWCNEDSENYCTFHKYCGSSLTQTIMSARLSFSAPVQPSIPNPTSTFPQNETLAGAFCSRHSSASWEKCIWGKGVIYICHFDGCMSVASCSSSILEMVKVRKMFGKRIFGTRSPSVGFNAWLCKKMQTCWNSKPIFCAYHLLQNDYSLDALQFDCFRINIKL